MRRAFLATSVLAAALAFGSLPALAGVSADVNVRVGHRGEAFDECAPRGDWQSGSEYGYTGGQWDNGGQWGNDACRQRGARQWQYRSGGQYGGRQYGGGQYGSGRWNHGGRRSGGWNRDRSGRGWGDNQDHRWNRDDDRNGY